MASFWRQALQIPVVVVMAAYYALTAIIGPIVDPVARVLAGIRAFAVLRGSLERLGPYSCLAILVIPVIVIEPMKIASFAIIGSGRFVLGTAALAISQGLSLIVIERLFGIVKPKLLTLRWFALVWSLYTDLRDRLLSWLGATRAWSIVLRVRDAMRSTIHRIRRSKGLMATVRSEQMRQPSEHRDPSTYGNLAWAFGDSVPGYGNRPIYGLVSSRTDRSIRSRPGGPHWISTAAARAPIWLRVPKEPPLDPYVSERLPTWSNQDSIDEESTA